MRYKVHYTADGADHHSMEYGTEAGGSTSGVVEVDADSEKEAGEKVKKGWPGRSIDKVELIDGSKEDQPET